jgi:hypothetical protein
MFQTKDDTHVVIFKYTIVGFLVFVSVVLVGVGVWNYTYQQNLAEPTRTTTTEGSNSRYTAEEWEEIRNAEPGTTTPRYEAEEWEAIRQANSGSNTSRYSEEEWEAIRNSN